MRVSIMFRPEGEAPERAAGVAAALEGAGHEVGSIAVSAVPGAIRTVARSSPEVVHTVGTDVAGPGAVAARLAGAALVCEALPTDPAPDGGISRALRTAVGARRGGTVLVADTDRARRLRAELDLPYLPVVVGDLQDPGSTSVLIAVYDRLPRLNPELPVERARAAGGAREWARELGRPLRRGALRHPGALLAYLRGRLLRSRGRLPAAVETLTRAAERDRDDPIYRLYLAKALRESGASDEALEQLEDLAGGADAHPELLGEVGVELTRLDQRNRAEDIASRLASPGGGDPPVQAYAEAARVYAAAGDLRAARELGLRAAAQAPDGSTSQRTAARALEQSGEPSRALDLARRAGAREQERRVEGLLRELAPGWVPQLDGRSEVERSSPSRVMTLLEVSLPQAPSGYAYRSRDLLAALRGGGFDPVAATRLGFPASRGERDWSPVESVDGVVHHRFNVPGVRQYSGVPLDLQLEENAKRVLEVVHRHGPAAIIAGTPDLNGVVALAVRSATGVPVIYDVRGFPEMSWAAHSGGSDSELYRRRREAETACASAADAVITLSETMRQELAGRGVDPDRIFVVPQIVDAKRFAPSLRNEELARSYGLDGSFVVGTVSSLTDYEGIDDLLRAVAGVRAARPQIAALIVGDGTYRPALEELAAELGIGDAVIFTGRLEQEQVPDHYALLDLFAIPRRDLEVCRAVTPLKPFEALSMEIPVLATDLPALDEIVTSSGGGRSVPPGSVDALAQAILDLEADPDARKEMGGSGREHVLTQHTPERASAAVRLPIAALVGKNTAAR
jgi:glycosyltransferase involved in cell wall biosynthesis/Flp pilus assembly protein TadD